MILVTGGTGLVGSHLLFKLVSNNENVRAIYRREKTLQRVKHVFSYFSDDAETLFNTIEWVKGDINDIPQLENAFKDITSVYHCAAFVSFEPDKYKTLSNINPQPLISSSDMRSPICFSFQTLTSDFLLMLRCLWIIL